MSKRYAVVAVVAMLAASPAMAQEWKWNGLYVGGSAGYGFGSWDGQMSFPPNACCAVGPLDTSTHSITADGAIAGGQIGVNLQAGYLVYGLEADGSWANLNGASGAKLEPFPTNFPANGEPYWGFGITSDWLATVRGRLGVANGPGLYYVTGGLALGGFSETHVLGDPGNGACAGPCPTASRSDTKVGWTAGAGAEYALDKHWSIRAEYLYLSFPGTGGVTQWDNPKFGPGTDGFKGDFNANLVRAGLNYRF